MLSVALFALGAVVASFMGVVVARLHTGQSFIVGHSYCDVCGAPLTPLSLIPIVSYVALRGRARCCGAKISLLAPVSELTLGVLFVAAYRTLGLTGGMVLLLAALALLLGLVLYDLAHQILPPWLLAPFVITSVLVMAATASPSEVVTAIVIAAGIGASLAAIHYLSKGRAMGLADAPLAFGLALITGPYALTGFVFSFWIGAAVGIVLLARRPAGSRMGVEVPFAPFLACGFLLAYFTQWNLFTYLMIFPR